LVIKMVWIAFESLTKHSPSNLYFKEENINAFKESFCAYVILMSVGQMLFEHM
jgi:hypothetical protein